MTLAATFLEKFDDAPAAIDAELSYEDGYQAGYEEGLREGLARQNAQVSEIAMALASLNSDREAVRADVLVSLRPMFNAITEQVLPNLMQDLIGLQLVDALLVHAELATETSITVCACAEDIDVLAQATSEAGLALQLVPDPNLSKGTFAIRTPVSEDIVDLTEICDAVRSALSALTAHAEGETDQ